MTEAYDLFQQGRAHLKAHGRAGHRRAREGEAARARQGVDPRGARDRVLPHPRWTEAEAEFRAVLELSPADDYAHYALGRTLEKQGRDAEANGHYKLASSLSREQALLRAHHGARPQGRAPGGGRRDPRRWAA